jgi:hypothetical protein
LTDERDPVLQVVKLKLVLWAASSRKVVIWPCGRGAARGPASAPNIVTTIKARGLQHLAKSLE